MRITSRNLPRRMLSRFMGLISFIVICQSLLWAQKCGDTMLDSDIGSYLREAVELSEGRLIYKVCAIVGKRAIPELRRIKRSGQYGKDLGALIDVDAIQKALAKLGDQGTLKELSESLDKEEHKNRAISILAFAADDGALSILMKYFIKHESDGSIVVARGDTVYDPRGEIIDSIERISFSKRVPALALPIRERTALQVPFYQEWRNWWDIQKGRNLSLPLYPAESSPKLKCLATMADWGIYDAIIEMADLREKEAEMVLRQYPKQSESSLGTISGNVDVALARLGDKQVLNELINDLRNERFEYRLTALSKLKLVNSKSVVDSMIEVLGIADGGRQAEGYQHYNKIILRALAEMVKDPPLDVDAEESTENIAIWKDWWAQNRATAVLIGNTDY